MPEALAALGLATELAHGTQATLAVRRVVEDMVPLLSAEEWVVMKDWSNLWEDERRSAQAGAEEAASHRGVPVEASATVGDPGAQLRALSESVDVVVVSSRRWGPFARLLAGGVGVTPVADAACSVVIVPRAAVPAAVSGPHLADGATNDQGELCVADRSSRRLTTRRRPAPPCGSRGGSRER